jgi:hypothetical protein
VLKQMIERTLLVSQCDLDVGLIGPTGGFREIESDPAWRACE